MGIKTCTDLISASISVITLRSSSSIILLYRKKNQVLLHMWQHGFIALKHKNSGNSINMAGALHCRGIQGFQEAGAFKGRGVAREIPALLDRSGERASLVLPDSWRMRISW